MIGNMSEILCFGLVCEAKTMTAASKLMGCSTAQVSRYISSLEKRIGTKLFYRTTRKLTLTDAGKLFKEDAVQLLRNAQMVEKKSNTFQEGLCGKFAITAPISLATYLLVPIFSKLQKRFQDVDFEIIPTNENLKLIDDGIDLAIRTSSVVDDSLVAYQIGSAHDVFCASHEYINTNTEPQQLSDLNKHRIVLNQHSFNKDIIKLYNEEQSLDWLPKNTTMINLYTLSLDLIALNGGVGFVPNYCIASPQKSSQGVKRVLSKWKGKEWPIYMVHPFQIPTPPKLAAISLFLKSEMKHLISN